MCNPIRVSTRLSISAHCDFYSGSKDDGYPRSLWFYITLALQACGSLAVCLGVQTSDMNSALCTLLWLFLPTCLVSTRSPACGLARFPPEHGLVVALLQMEWKGRVNRDGLGYVSLCCGKRSSFVSRNGVRF